MSVSYRHRCDDRRVTDGEEDGSRSARGMSLRHAVDEYLLYLKAVGRSQATTASYSVSLAMLTATVPEEFPLSALSADFLVNWMASLKVPNAIGQRKSETTLNRFRTTYRAFARWAFESGRIPFNPALLLHLARVDSPRTPAITLLEIRKLLDTIRHSGDPLRLRDEALFQTYAMTGIRRTEALTLAISDYNAEAATLTVNCGKGRQIRTVPVADSLGSLLQQWLEHQFPSGAVRSGTLFGDRLSGQAISPRQANARFQHWRRLAGLSGTLTIQSFRVGFATVLHADTSDLMLLSRALGHRDVRPIQRYIDPATEKLRLAIERSFSG